MVKIMYKEISKSGINPIASVVIWAISLYLFHILWGISEILFEFSFPMGKYILAILVTVIFGWFLVTKIISEYEISVGSGKLTVTKIQSRRRQTPVAMVALPNIVSVFQGKKLTGKYAGAKVYALTRPMQKGETIYVVFKDDKSFAALKLKGTKKLISVLKKRGSE